MWCFGKRKNREDSGGATRVSEHGPFCVVFKLLSYRLVSSVLNMICISQDATLIKQPGRNRVEMEKVIETKRQPSVQFDSK